MTGVTNSLTKFSCCRWSAGGFQIPGDVTFGIVKEVFNDCRSPTPFLVCKAWAQIADNEFFYASIDPSKVFPKLNMRILDIPKWRECFENPEKLGLDLYHPSAFTKADFIMLKECQDSGIEAENEKGCTIIDIPAGHSWKVLERMALMGAVPLTLTSKVELVDEFTTQRMDTMRRYVVPNDIVQYDVENGWDTTACKDHAFQKKMLTGRGWEMIDGLTAGTLVVLTQKVFNIYLIDCDDVMTHMNTTSQSKDGDFLIFAGSSEQKELTVIARKETTGYWSIGAGAMKQLPGKGL